MAIVTKKIGDRDWLPAMFANDDFLNSRLTTSSDWNTAGVTLANGFSHAVTGNDLGWEQIKHGDGTSEYRIAAQLNLPTGGLPSGQSIKVGSIPLKAIPDRGTFLGQATIIQSDNIMVAAGNIRLSVTSSGLDVVFDTLKSSGVYDIAPNGWLGLYISFTGNSI